ncbi:MAG: hypothetical protein ACOC33_02265 [bacterium]
MEKDLNFGIVKHNLIKQLSEKTDKNNFLKLKNKYIDFINVIKSSPLLTLEFFIFKNIENKNIINETSALRYIDENINLIKNVTYSDIVKEHEKLRKYYFDKEISDSKLNLYESIQNIIVEKVKEIPNIDLLHESIEFVLDQLKTPKETLNESISLFDNVKNDFDFDFIIEKTVEKFNHKYSHLSENEKKLIKVLIEEDESAMVDLLIKTKENIINSLNKEKLNQDEKTVKMIEESINKVNSMEYNNKTFVNDMVKLFDLLN